LIDTKAVSYTHLDVYKRQERHVAAISLRRQARKQLKEVGWTKGIELATLARRDRQHFDCATGLHRAREMPKE